MSAAGRTRITTSPGSTPASAGRSKSPPSSRIGGASATPTGRRAGSITRCCQASAWLSVQLKSKTDLAPLHAKPDAESAVLARLQSGVLGSVKHCNGSWCRLDRRRLRRLDRTAAAVGRLSGREDRVTVPRHSGARQRREPANPSPQWVWASAPRSFCELCGYGFRPSPPSGSAGMTEVDADQPRLRRSRTTTSMRAIS